MSAEGASPSRGVWHDPVVWLLVAVLFGLIVPYALPGLDPRSVYRFGENVGMPLLLLAALLAILWGVRALRAEAERRFWYLIAIGLGFNLLVRIIYVLPVFGSDRGALLSDVAYVLFYFALIRALRVRPDRRDETPTGPLVWVDTLATAVFLTGLLVYFVLVPRSLTPAGYGTWVPSLLLYWVLDGYLLLTLIHLHQSSASERWRVVYGLLGLAVFGWVATDLYEVLDYVGRVEWIDDASPWNTIWYLPYGIIGFAGRVRTAPWPKALARIGLRPDAAVSKSGTVGIVVLYATVLPVLHFASNLLGLMDPGSRDARELTVLVFLPLLLGIAFVHQRMLERRAHELEATGLELEEQRALLSTAIEQAVSSIIVTDAAGRIAYANPAWERASGYPREDLVGRPVEEVLKALGEEAVTLFQNARPERISFVRIKRETSDGTQVEEEFSISPVSNAAGKLTHFSLSLRDVTNESKLERQLQQAQRMEALGTLAGGIAHDFNNMLAAILGYSELLLDRSETDPAVREDVTEILKAAERAKGLTSQILMFSRQEDAERRPVYLGTVVAEALKLVRPTIASSIAVRAEVDPGVGLILAEESRVHQVVMNLVTNSVQAMGEKGSLRIAVEEAPQDWSHGAARLSVELPAGDYAVLTVSDDGPGMAPETLDRMYDPFYTTKRVGHGTGLGLSVVHGIVTSHGGGISVESEPGAGSTFRVYLPLATSVPEAVSPDGAEARPGTGTPHLLLVDDEEMVADVLSRGLERSGFRVTVVTDPKDALLAFLAAPGSFHALITDQTMPGLTGLELATEVHRVRPRLPVLLLTGYSESVTPERVVAAGVSEVMYKPVNRADLVAAIERQIDGRAGGRRG